MRKIVIATHSRMAAGLQETLTFIAGSQENVTTLTAYLTADYTIQSEIATLFNQLQDTDELIVVVDLLGGSVANAFSSEMTRDNFYLISGVNLPLLLTLCLSTEKNTAKLVESAIESGKNGIQYVNQLLAADWEEDL